MVPVSGPAGRWSMAHPPTATELSTYMAVPVAAEAGERHRQQPDGTYLQGECIKTHTDVPVTPT